jgi:ribosome-associated protein
MVVASGTSNRHVASIAEKLISILKKELGVRIKTEGMGNSDWVLIDSGDIIIHVFREEVRDFYQLEKLWQQSPTTLSDVENA